MSKGKRAEFIGSMQIHDNLLTFSIVIGIEVIPGPPPWTPQVVEEPISDSVLNKKSSFTR